MSGTTDLAGAIAVNLVNAGHSAPGRQQFRVFTGEGSLDTAERGLTYAPSAVARHALVFATPNEVGIQTDIDFCPTALSGNRKAVGDAVNTIQTMGGCGCSIGETSTGIC